MTFTIDSITLSPVAYKVDYTVDSEVVWSNSGSGRQSEEDGLSTTSKPVSHTASRSPGNALTL